MARNALEIVPIIEARSAMRLVGDDAQHDALIARYIVGAVEWVERLCRIGIVDTPLSETVGAPAGDEPLVIRHRSHAIRDVSARPSDEPLATPMALSLAPATEAGKGFSLIAMPAGGWPNSSMRVDYTLTTPADAVPGAIRTAIILLCRDMYDMREEVGGSGGVGSGRPWAVYAMIAPYRDNRLTLEDAGWPTPATLDAFPLTPEG